ncbi:MAG: polyketide synthase, partial [Planctomycetota bacterium]
VAASAFLDAYAQSVDRRDQRRTVSIDWGVWREAGLAAQASHADVRRAAAAPAARAPRRTPRLAPQRARDGAAAGPFVLETRYSPQTHWLLDEHRTRDGIAVLPGTAYLEMARAALIEIGAAPVFELCDLALLRPLIVADGEARDVRVELQPEPGGFAFRVLSRSDARELHAGLDASAAPAEWIVHAQAAVRVDAPRAAADAPLREIEARCATHRIADGAPALAAIQAGRMRFGSRWQALREVRLGPGEALATLELPPGLVGDLDQYGLHPALLDIATTCGLELAELHAAAGPDRPAVGGAAGAGLWVPLSYRSVRVHAPLGASVRSWLRGSRSNRAGADILSFDVTLTDAQGRSCVEIDDFALRRTRGALAMAAAAPSARPRAARADSERAADESERASARPASPALAALRRNLEQGIRPAEGVEALVRILAGPQHAQIVATTLDLDGLRAQAQALGAPADAAAGATDAAATRAADGGGFVDASDGIEHVLAGFWKELLGVASVGVRDNFFDLGGHSLIAVRLFARIKRAFQVDFPISLLFEAPTIERCAAAIRAAQGSARAPEEARARPEQARFTHLVPMHSGRGGDGTPLFVVAGMFGNVLNLRHLVNLLGDDRPCFGLQALGLYGAQSPHETFEQMAGDYLVEMRRVQPHGPYLLSGFSGGGITAFEIARQLLASGEEVALLALLDTAVPEPPQLRASERARIHWQRMLRRGPAYLAEWAREKLDYQRARARQRRADAHPVAMPSEFRSDEIGRAFRRALGRYRVRGYPGVLTLFRPPLEIAHVLGPRRRANAKRELVFPDNGWGAYARRVDVHEVPGDHDSMVLEPNVRVLAAKLRHCIAAVEPRTRNGVAR